jgi:hypothetical protein
VIAACRRAGARFSITCGMNPSVKRAVLAIYDTAWQQITYPTAVPDPDTGELIFDAQVAEIPAYTAFTGPKKSEQVTSRLIVRRVRDLAKPATVGEQGELFPVWRYHPFFTDNPAETLQAEREHRHHAVVEQVIADSKASALAHLPSGHFHANAAWLTLWAMTYNLLRAAGALTSAFHAKATTATLRAHLVDVPARIARSARRLTLHLPEVPRDAECVDRGQMGLMRGTSTMAAPRKYSKTTELGPDCSPAVSLSHTRTCPSCGNRASASTKYTPTLDGSSRTLRWPPPTRSSTSSTSSKGNCRVSSPRCPGAKTPSATVMDDVSVTVEH